MQSRFSRERYLLESPFCGLEVLGELAKEARLGLLLRHDGIAQGSATICTAQATLPQRIGETSVNQASQTPQLALHTDALRPRVARVDQESGYRRWMLCDSGRSLQSPTTMHPSAHRRASLTRLCVNRANFSPASNKTREPGLPVPSHCKIVRKVLALFADIRLILSPRIGVEFAQ